MTQPQQTAREEWKAHWPFVVSAMVGFSFYTVVTYALGTFTQPLEKAFGWTRAEVFLGVTIFGLVQMVGGPPVGALLDRIGTRWLAIIGLTLAGVAYAGFSLANGSIAQWIGIWLVFSLCALMIKSTVWSAGTSSVFSTSRGLALAAVLSGSAIGQALSPILANWLIETQGWQNAYRWLGFGWAGLGLVLVSLFFFDARALAARGRKSVTQAASAKPPPTAIALTGLSAREALRDSRIVRMAVANLLMASVGGGVTAHLVPLIAETGLTRDTAVQMAATAGIAGLVGKFLTGWLVDRYRGNIVPFFSFAIAALGHVLLLDTLGTPIALTAGAMILGYASGAGLQVTTYLVSRYAGLKNFGIIFGSISSMMLAGTAIGPLVAGAVHDAWGNYAPLLMVAAPTMLLCALLFVGLGEYPDFNARKEGSDDRPQPAAAQ